jgi:hypothetical protein
MAGSYKCGNEPSAYMKGEKFIHQLSGYQLLKKGPAPCIRKMDMVTMKDTTVLRVRETGCP